jgi:starch synthase
MRILFITAEIFPLAKTGGLGDVSAALPGALREMGEDVRVLVPAYRQALEAASKLKEIARFGDFLGCGETRLLETHLPKTGVPVWLIDCPQLFDRAGGPYQDENGAEWHDNAQRFAVLNHVAAGIANERGAAWRPDIVHANDWHAGLVPLLLSGRTKQPSVFTIHNLAYQGVFPFDRFDSLNLPADAANHLEFYGRMSFLKAGIGAADAITTVSPTYAREIVNSDYGCGMDGLLRERAASLTGILNGADYGFWDPAIDSHLVSNYTVRSLGPKQACKRAVQAELGLGVEAERPLLAFMSRLAHQKMPDSVIEILPRLIDDGIQFALVADADGHYQHGFRELAERYPGRVALRIGYQEAIAHRLLAGADMLVHPSRFEPCGLLPMYAMRYGTVPIVRNSGGLADTVVDATPEAISSRTATGFHFQQAESEELLACVRRALALYRQPISWRRLQVNAMQQDFGWHRAAQSYIDLYRGLLQIPAQEPNSSQAKGIPAVAQA